MSVIGGAFDSDDEDVVIIMTFHCTVFLKHGQVDFSKPAKSISGACDNVK